MGVYGRRLACPGSRRWLRRGRWAIEHNVLVGVWTQESAGEASAGEASAGEASAALACRRWGLAVTCACVVRHCACVHAPPMGAIPSGGLHLLGRIARDQFGLNLPDRVFRLIGNKLCCGAGR